MLSVATLSTCGGSGSGGVVTAGAPRQLSGNEQRYGASANRDPKITYQPDVIVLGGGADSVRSVSSDGLVWTIDGGAPGVGQLQPGKVLFATSLGAGRVLGVEDDGPNKRVALGPIALTDLIKDGQIRSDQPVPLRLAQAYSTPDAPGQVVPADQPTRAQNGPATEGDRAALTAFHRAGGPSMASPKSGGANASAGGWQTYSICCTSNGLHATYDGNGARVQATGEIKFTNPSVTFDLVIRGGHLVDAGMRLNGAATLTLGFSAAVTASANATRSGKIEVPISIEIPVPVGGLPFTIGFQQIFEVNAGLSGQAALSTEGEYRIGGTLGFGFHNGSAKADTPTLTTVRSALDNIRTLAVASQGLTLGWALKTTIGVGVSSLSAGLWFKVAAAISVATSGAQVDQIQGTSLVSCKTVSLSLDGSFGVGYSIPKFVANAINTFLAAVMQKPPAPIQPVGGSAWGPYELFKKNTAPCVNSRFSK